MSNLARVMDTHHLPDVHPPEGIAELARPSVGLYRLRNAPDIEDADPNAMTCKECGSESIRTEWREINAQTMTEPAENDIYATCQACGEGWPVDDIRDLANWQRPS